MIQHEDVNYINICEILIKEEKVLIEVKNLVKKYGDYLAVDNLSFTLEKGQILGFLGPNGAGKSTTMNIITGYISATEGTAVVNGYDIYDQPEEAKRCIGYLPEIPPLYPDMTVREYLNFAADIKKVKRSEREKDISDVMNMTKITDVSERLIKHLSKGYKQRVGLAQAIIGYPELLILDEPTVGLDPMQIIEIRDLIRSLSKNHTIILSSHILSEVSAICDEVMIINKGKLIVRDTPDNLSKHIGGSNGLHLQVKGEKEIIQKALSEIEGITQIEYETKEQEGILKLTIYSGEEIDIRENVFFALSDVRCPILDMTSTMMSLEDIFLELTQEETNQEEGNHEQGNHEEMIQEEAIQKEIVNEKNTQEEAEVQEEVTVPKKVTDRKEGIEQKEDETHAGDL
jgi:ABC-2 type transport system ATP-binding protein